MAEDKTILADSVHSTSVPSNERYPPCLVQYSGDELGRRFLLDQPELIAGRTPPALILINHVTVSKQHARFRVRGDSIAVEDLGATNGTFVNDKKIGSTPVLIKDGDVVRLGKVLFKYFAKGNLENAFHDKIISMATIDAGTQVYNKKYVMQALDSEFTISRNYNRKLSVIFYDLDFFKKVNDTYGHNAGDYILKEAAKVAKNTLRRSDILGRVGGEEFLVVLPDTDSNTAVDLAERIRKAVSSFPFEVNKKKVQQTISLGVSQLSANMKSSLELLESADKKLYESKNSGRNKVTF